MSEVPFIAAPDVRRLAPMPELIAALRDAFASAASVPTRTTHDLGDGASLLLMPAWTGASIGVKVATVFPMSRPAVRGTYLLLDGTSGAPRAILDGSMLTLRRTAAASALAARMLARPDAATLLVAGTGALCLHLIEAHASGRALSQILIWGRDPIKAERMAREARSGGFACAAAASLDDAVRRADIISTATLATVPLIKGALVRPGTHLDLVGAFRPGMSEADPEAFRRARVFVDTMEGALTEAGDLLQAIEAGALKRTEIESDLKTLCQGAHPGRGEDSKAITLFKSVGTSLEDLAAADLIIAGWMRERSASGLPSASADGFRAN